MSVARLATIHPDARKVAVLREWIDAEDDLDLVATAADAAAGRVNVADTDPDVVIVALRLAGGDGTRLCRRLITDSHLRRVLIWSDRDSSLFAERALEAGAFGFVLESAGGDAFVEAVRTIRDGGLYVAPRLERRMVPLVPPVTTLGDAEREVVAALRAGAPTPTAVARELDVAVREVAQVERRLIRRLGVYSRAGVRLYAHRSRALASAVDMDSASV